jgi:hypothetical protein
LVIRLDLDRDKGSGGIALLQFTPPSVKAGLREAVAGTESSNSKTTVLPELDQASPMLLFVRIALFAVGHDDALLSEGLHHGCQKRDSPDAH